MENSIKKGYLDGINLLPEETARGILLYYQDKKSIQEISLLTGRSQSIVRNHHNRGLFLLRKFKARKEMKKP
jgi:DNA-directed RNA polymerase specialized sigma24 family protein